MKYYISKKLNTSFEQAVQLVTESLKERIRYEKKICNKSFRDTMLDV